MADSEDTHAQIARLRAQVETLMKDRVTPALADAAGRAEEAVRLRRRAQRALIAAILASIASVFMLGALVFCHVAAWFYLRAHWEQPATALILAGSDVLLALVLVLFAARSTTSRVELEALA